ncbi:unnamed protein product, partial [marine sediment metagenome]
MNLQMFIRAWDNTGKSFEVNHEPGSGVFYE